MDKQFEERDKAERANQKKVNEVCVKEWELRIKAKEFLRKIKSNTNKQINFIMQDTLTKTDRATQYNDKPKPQFSRKGIFNPAHQ